MDTLAVVVAILIMLVLTGIVALAGKGDKK
jgi:hypothetical protein